ncbi:NADH dehydrogenase-like protein YjlD [Rubripirellula tenax]|uniref:NADH:ubiquinone reductase (non-electrogenic) n=1 Tax=Rubripirellula tenax TaxID=2528015 RepID=A0A5C6ET69_9BACT|nr:NAD(P)/FAD-dependent oxidoreductase [Rubripirellula tenax]TWU50659.1 NADH dehydrogenase-like protein YjlD [Rubripirellula tenax]
MNRPLPQNVPHVVIVGGGFGGLETARRLKRADVRVTMIDRHNYHLFQPLLYQVATGGLSPANIATPLRSIVRRQANCEVLMGEVIGFDVAQRRLILADDELQYDFLVLAAGATHSYFGRDEWAKFAPGLKTISDAADIRGRIYVAFEAAEREPDPEIRKSLMTFVVVGGGPTGVELAGALAEIARHTLKRDFRHIRPQDARIIIVEAAPRILSHYPDDLCEQAIKKVRSLGIEVMIDTKVTDINDTAVHLSTPNGDTVVRTKTVLWGAGVQANPLGRLLADDAGVTTDRGGRIPVTPTCQIENHNNVFAIGDIAVCLDESGKPLPGLAAVAVQQGAHVASVIKQSITQPGRTLSPFRYSNKGSMATIGRAAAVAQIGSYKTCGWFAWILWLFVHLMLIVQFQNRLLILIQWAWSYATFNRSNRIILGEPALFRKSAKSKTQDTSA